MSNVSATMNSAADINWSLAAEIERQNTIISSYRYKIETLEAQVDESIRSCLAEREGRLKAESELSTLRARVREIVGPFVSATLTHDGQIVGLLREDFDAARRFMEELK